MWHFQPKSFNEFPICSPNANDVPGGGVSYGFLSGVAWVLCWFLGCLSLGRCCWQIASDHRDLRDGHSSKLLRPQRGVPNCAHHMFQFLGRCAFNEILRLNSLSLQKFSWNISVVLSTLTRFCESSKSWPQKSCHLTPALSSSVWGQVAAQDSPQVTLLTFGSSPPLQVTNGPTSPWRLQHLQRRDFSWTVIAGWC